MCKMYGITPICPKKRKNNKYICYTQPFCLCARGLFLTFGANVQIMEIKCLSDFVKS